MRLLRHTVVQRWFCLGLLLSLGLWLTAPVASAAPRTLGFGTEAPPTVEAAFEQALAEAAQAGARSPDAFAAAFAEALAAQADPELARFLEEHANVDVLSLLYGQWLRAFSPYRGLEAAASSPPVAPAGPSLTASALGHRTATLDRVAPPTPRPVAAPPAVPLAERSAAQPLGP